jgi:hypothetical protein
VTRRPWLGWGIAAMLLSAAPAEAQRSRPSAAALEAARAFLCPNGGTPQRGGRCRPGQDARGWDRGLPPSNRAQQPCPPGTRPQAARAQAEITRCVPE